MKRLVKHPFIALVLLASLAGCGGGKKNVATVNGDAIPADEFQQRTQNVDVTELAPALQPGNTGIPPKAGEYALRALIDQKLIAQYAKEKNATPTEAEISSYMAFYKKYQNPQLTMVSPDPYRSDAMLRAEIKQVLTYRKLLTQAAGVQPADVQKEYDKLKTQLVEPAKYHLRLINVSTKEKAQAILQRLNQNVPFETEALKELEDKATAMRNGDAGTFPENYLERTAKGLLDAIKNLKPGEYTKTPVPVQVQGGTAPGSPAAITHYFLAQVVDKTPARTPTMEEVRPILEMAAVRDKDPNSFQRLASAVSDVRQKAVINVDPAYKEYQPLVAQIKAPIAAPTSPQAPLPGPGGPAPGGPAPGGPAPSPTPAPGGPAPTGAAGGGATKGK